MHLEKKGEPDIDAENVKAADRTVTAQVNIPQEKQGVWNIAVDDGAKSIAVAQLELKSELPTPKVTAISPNPLNPTGQAQNLTLTESNLGRITKLHFDKQGEAAIVAENVKAGDTVTAQVNLRFDK